MRVQHRAVGGPRVTSLLGPHAPTLSAHLDLFGPLPDCGGRELLDQIAQAGLTGRGGGYFATARKLALVAGTPIAIVIANAAEGEPASSKDRVLLGDAPHLVLDGLTLVARIAGARSTHLAGPADLLEAW